MTWVVEEYLLPEVVDASFRELASLRNGVEAHALGSSLLALEPEELLPIFRDRPRRRRRHFVVRDDGVLVGRGILTLHGGSEAVTAGLNVDVPPEHRGRGVGAALLDRAERAARDEGRTILQCTTVHSDAGGEPVVPATGHGQVRSGDPGVRFLGRHGYSLEQVSRVSVLAPEPVDPPEVDARWRLHAWTGATPDRWLAELAGLKTVMETAAPSGELTVDGHTWSSGDVRDRDAALLDGGRTLLTCVVEQVASGRLVALTEIDVPRDDRPAIQEDTLVLPEHRGHRLGTVVKQESLRRLVEQHPRIRALVTFNAEENRPMLDVNEALGFRPIGYEGVWEKR